MPLVGVQKERSVDEMSRQPKLNSAKKQDLELDIEHRLELAAELLARIAVRIATSGDMAEQQPDADAEREAA